MTKLIDLSVPISKKAQLRVMPKMTFWSHEERARLRAETFGIKVSDFREGKFAAWEEITLPAHMGTHLDAPWHYAPTSEGKPAKTIDQIPLEWCFSDGVVLDFHYKERGAGIRAQEIKEQLGKIGYCLKPFDIVLIRTDASKHWGEQNYEDLGVGVTAEATRWLIDERIKVMGIDSFTWDKPFDIAIDRLKQGKKDEFWESHYLGKEREYCHVENLANLDRIPIPFGFKVSLFPIKVEGFSGSWVRAVAILED